MSLITKGLNLLTLYIGISPAIPPLLAGNIQGIVNLYSAGLAAPGGNFNRNLAVKAYGPILAAILFRKGISELRKVAHV